MQFTSIFALIGIASAAVMTTTACNANNCARQVRAIAFPTRSTAADCSRYQTTRSTPVTTVYVSSLSASATPTAEPARTIPAYASGCADDAAYRSACSCIGSTSTLIVATATSTVTALCSTYVLRATDGPAANRYFRSSNGDVFLNADSLAAAQRFVYRDNHLFEAGNEVNGLNAVNRASQPVRLDDLYNFGPNRPLFDCDIAAGSGAVTCTQSGDASRVFQIIPGDANPQVFYASPPSEGGNAVVVPQAIQACPA